MYGFVGWVLTVFLVDSSMTLQCEPIGKGGRANFTFEWFLARMDFSMVLQVRCLTERRATYFTPEYLQKKNTKSMRKLRNGFGH